MIDAIRTSPPGPLSLGERILEQSSSSWGEYLDLLEAPSSEELDGVLQPEESTSLDSLPAIDAQALLRLFTGCTSGGESEPKGPSPAAVVNGSRRASETQTL